MPSPIIILTSCFDEPLAVEAERVRMIDPRRGLQEIDAEARVVLVAHVGDPDRALPAKSACCLASPESEAIVRRLSDERPRRGRAA